MEPRKCSNCGAPLPENKSVCQYCKTQHVEQNAKPLHPVFTLNKPKILAIVLLLCGFGMASAFFMLEGGPEPAATIQASEIIQFLGDKARPKADIEVAFQERFVGKKIIGEGRITYRRLSSENRSILMMKVGSDIVSSNFKLTFHPSDNDMLRELDKNRYYEFTGKIMGIQTIYTVDIAQVKLRPVGEPPQQSFKPPTLEEITKRLKELKVNQPITPKDLYWFTKIDWIERETMEALYENYLAGVQIQGMTKILTIKKDNIETGTVTSSRYFKGGNLLMTLHVVPDEIEKLKRIRKNQEVEFSGVMSKKKWFFGMHVNNVKLSMN